MAKNTGNYSETPVEALMRQHASIAAAISILQKELDDSTSECNPDTVTWKDVGVLAKIAEYAQGLVDACGEEMD